MKFKRGQLVSIVSMTKETSGAPCIVLEHEYDWRGMLRCKVYMINRQRTAYFHYSSIRTLSEGILSPMNPQEDENEV